MHRLPVLLPGQAGSGFATAAGRDHHPHPHGPRVSHAGSACQVLRPGHDRADRSRARHRGPPRRLCHGLRRQVLRRHRLPRPQQLQRQLQHRAGQLRHCRSAWLDGDQFFLQYLHRRARGGGLRRTLVAPGRLCIAARLDRSGLRVLGLPGRHQPGQRLEPHGYSGARVRRGPRLSPQHCAPGYARIGAHHEQTVRIPSPHLGADP